MHTGSVTYVIAPNGEGEWVEVNDKESMEQALADENNRRFNQAATTPFMVPPLSNYIDHLGINQYSQQILDGTFEIPEGTDHYAARLIPHLKRSPLVVAGKGSSLEFTAKEHRRGWKKAKEATSSGPSGIHFGHFIAGSTHEAVCLFDATMTNFPYKSGYSPDRWQQGTNVMLEKKPGNFQVDKLRAILLYEPDFNHNNKRLGRDAMYYAEELEQIAKEQYGSRKNRAANDQCLNKELTTDLLRQKKQPGALNSNDAKACYDRIVHSVASLCLQRNGVPKHPVI
jgi:hypothetical protein